MDREKWEVLEEFPDYVVSNHGRVMTRHTELIKTPTRNQQGIPSVLLMRDRIQYRRSVAVLVAHHFVPNNRHTFDTPINLDGDRMNNHYMNLMWRPRWFAVKYHAQFKQPQPFNFRGKIHVVEDDVQFDDLMSCAVYYGLLMREILMSAHTYTPVFPTWQTFVIIPYEE